MWVGEVGVETACAGVDVATLLVFIESLLWVHEATWRWPCCNEATWGGRGTGVGARGVGGGTDQKTEKKRATHSLEKADEVA